MSDEDGQDGRAGLVAAGQRAVTMLVGSVEGKDDASPIETNAGSLRGLAQVIAALIAEIDRCAGIDCMGRSVDGIKLWVTRDRFDAESQRVGEALASAERYADALRSIAAAGATDTSTLDMLVDWHMIALSLSRTAAAALSGAVTIR